MNCVKIYLMKLPWHVQRIKTCISNLYACIQEKNTPTCKFDNGKYLETFTIGIFKMLC